MDQCDLLTESSAVRMLYIRLLEELRKKKKRPKISVLLQMQVLVAA